MTPVNKKSVQQGFSLVELAIVLLIVTLLLGGLLVPLSTQIDQQRTKDTQKTLAEIKEALIGFAIVNGRLPCPAAPNTLTGLESPVGGGNCTNYFNGLLPAATLGVTPINDIGLLLDGWNNPIRYAVTESNILLSPSAFTTTGGMKIATMNGISAATPLLVVCSNSANGIGANNCGVAPTVTLAGRAPALVFSLGRNGNRGALGPDQRANVIDIDRVFVSHPQSVDGAGNENFDDIVEWLSTGVLVNRLVSAGQLP